MASKKKPAKEAPAVEKKSYTVTLPVVGSIMVFVEAESKEQAVGLAFEQQSWRVVGSENTQPGEGWETHRSLLRGNVCNASFTEMTVECDDE